MANKFATTVFLFSFPRLFMMIRLSVREGRGKLDRTNSAKASFVSATGCCRFSLEFRGSTAYPCACLRSIGQKREKACQRMNSRQSFWLFPAWISMRMESRDSFYVQDGSFQKTRRSRSGEHLRRAGYETVRVKCGILQVEDC